jgi:hypothetical protein
MEKGFFPRPIVHVFLLKPSELTADASLEREMSAAQEATMNLLDQSQPLPIGFESDRRRYPRRTVNVQIEVRPDGSDIPLRLETTDLSRGGC